ncbi:replication protein A 70 kDa DNA-binding subunit-like [Daphnia pulex]|uniref:replication protein A 70 kDa DNA-binding subunit-like n=1 Tax=Daphnia pulex TaxID=6669 RepID=UPI001EE03866|nr:replication protein A 70 kDa DNA-binding subunit-like [Daphnia pulex]
MNRRNHPALTSGAIPSIIGNGLHNETPILQVLGYKNLQGDNNDRYRILISDGKYSYAYGMLATQLNHLIVDGQLENFTIIRVKKFVVNKVATKATAGKDQKKIIILLDVEPIVPGSEVGEKIGNPQTLNDVGEVTEEAAAKPAPLGNVNNYNMGSKSAPPNKTGGYGQPTEKSDIITHPIVSLTPYQNKWTVKVRIINKSDIRTWSNSRGEGKLFSMDMVDETGEIRATAFNAECDKFYHMIEIGKIFYISQAQLKAANKQYSSMRNDYEMSFNQNTTVIPCHDDTSDIPSISFNFVPIDQLPSLDKDSVIDVIGVVKSANDVRVIVSKTTNKELRMREVQMVDSTNTEVNLTLWGKMGEEFDASSQPVVALKGVKLSDFGGRSLGTVSSTVVQINPDMNEAHKLRGWYDNGGSSSAASSISASRGAGTGGSGGSYKTFAEAKFENLGKDKPDFYSVKAMVAMINKERALYMACPSDECNKKVIDQNNGLYRCEKCQREFQEFKWRMMLSVNIADATDQQWVTCFQETAETLLGKSADEVGRLKDSDNNEFQKIFEEATFKWYVFRLRVKMETYNDESRLKTNVYEVKEINYKEHNERLIREMKEMAASE